MNRELIEQICDTHSIQNAELVEKDIVLQLILLDLSKNLYFHSQFLFKGGTRLCKAYLDYERFSEDIDFTWKNQEEFAGTSQKRLRQMLSRHIIAIGRILETIAKSRNLDFKSEKEDKKYVEFGGSNKMCTFKLWYTSVISGRKAFIKMQINFVELLLFKSRKKNLRSLIDNHNKELEALFPEVLDYEKRIPFEVYDVKEILCEKIRAILTRKGIKARDFIDIYLIHEKFGISPEALKKEALLKIRSSFRLYHKYKANFAGRSTPVNIDERQLLLEVRPLLLKPINYKSFYIFLKSQEKTLDEIATALREGGS